MKYPLVAAFTISLALGMAAEAADFPIAGKWESTAIRDNIGRLDDDFYFSRIVTIDTTGRFIAEQCHSVVGQLSLIESGLAVSEIEIPHTGCHGLPGPESARWVTALELVRGYSVEGNLLQLLDESGKPILLLERR